MKKTGCTTKIGAYTYKRSATTPTFSEAQGEAQRFRMFGKIAVIRLISKGKYGVYTRK